MKFFLDQGLPYSTTHHLQAAGWDALHTVDAGMQRATDREIIEYARVAGRHCITLDADFHSIIAVENNETPSVIRIRQVGLVGKAMAELLIRICPDIEADLSAGALVTVTDNSVRVRHLPVQASR